MKMLKARLLIVVVTLLTISLQACKTKKVIAKANPPSEATTAPIEEKQPEPAPAEEKQVPAVVEKPDFNFSNVQFEFNSEVLKTASFEILDQVAKEMKKDPSIKFTLNGHSSVEGTAAHNMSLSVDRANSVKTYLVNAGINADNLTIKGFGSSEPVVENDTEEGRALSRRVEFKVN